MKNKFEIYYQKLATLGRSNEVTQKFKPPRNIALGSGLGLAILFVFIYLVMYFHFPVFSHIALNYF